MNRGFILTILSCVSLIAYSQDIEFELLGYGVFKDPTKFVVKHPDHKEALVEPGNPIQYNVDSLELKKGLEFGIDYQINIENPTENPYMIVRWKLPGMIEFNGNNTDELMYEFAVLPNVGQRISLELTTDEEMIPGVWTLQIEYEAGKFFEKEFTLYNREI